MTCRTPRFVPARLQNTRSVRQKSQGSSEISCAITVVPLGETQLLGMRTEEASPWTNLSNCKHLSEDYVECFHTTLLKSNYVYR